MRWGGGHQHNDRGGGASPHRRTGRTAKVLRRAGEERVVLCARWPPEIGVGCLTPEAPLYNPRTMKIATWTVNGIRARHEQFVAFAQQEQPDVICLQEIKAKLDQIPQSCSIEGYTCYWHGAGGYSGVGLHIRREFASNVDYTHPAFDLETRVVQAQIEDTVFTSVYVPNGGKDFEAKIAFINALIAYAADLKARGLKLVLCGDMNIARSERDVHPRERKPRTIGQLPQERELFERLLTEGGL